MQPRNHVTHTFHPSIFREYDIRGIFNETLFPADAYHIGLAYAALLHPALPPSQDASGDLRREGNTFLHPSLREGMGEGESSDGGISLTPTLSQREREKKVCVGFDGRLSSPVLSDELMRGLVDGGIDVVNIGLVPTPLLYFSVFHLDTDGGIMVTGSHNPGSHNGFKIMLGKESLHGADIRRLGEVRGMKDEGRSGRIEKIDLKEKYLNKILSSFINHHSSFKIGFDPGNGAAGEIAAIIAQKFGAKIINEKIDGNFPAHHPDPTVEANLEQLKKLVLDNKLDVGFAFDGDGDRVGVVDNKGRPIWGDQILAILAREVLEKHPGAAIIADVKTSSAVFDYIASLGGKPVMSKTGHSLVKAKMKELGSPLAGEMSAHIFIADDYFGYDDGIYAALRFLSVMQKTGKTSAELLDELPKMFSTPEIKIAVAEEEKFGLVDKVKTALIKDGAEFSDIDGVRVNNENGWWLLRASNTGAYLVARCEGKSLADLTEMETTLKSYLEIHGLEI